MATIGELIINLNANTASFVTDLNRVKNLSFDTASQIQRSFQLIGTAALGMLATAAAAFAVGVQKTAEWEVHILHLSEAAGTSVETMSGLAFAAKMMGLEIETVASAMERFDKQLIAAQLGNAKAGQNMSLLGIDPAAIKTSDDALRALADHFASLPDGAVKSGEAVQAFGKAGAAMIPILNLGAKGLDDFMAEAKSMGVVITTDQAKAAQQWEQNMTRMKESLHGLWVEMTNAVIPALNDLATHFEDTKKREGEWAAINEAAFAYLAGPVSASLYKQKSEELAAAQDKTRAKVQEVSTAVAASQKAFDAFYKSIDSTNASLETSIATFGKGALYVQQYKIEMEAAAAGLGKAGVEEAIYHGHLQAHLNMLQTLAPFFAKTLQDQQKRDMADKLALNMATSIELGKQLDIMMQMQFAPASSATLSPQANDAFTASITEQTAALEHQAATFGMSNDQIAVYDLRMLDSSAAAQAQIPVLIALQAQLKGMQDAATQVAQAAQRNAEAWKQFGDVAERSLSDLIFSGKSFTQVLADITKQLGEMFLKWSLFGFGGKSGGAGGLLGALGSLFTGGGGAPTASFGDLSALGMISPLPTFASGGPVSANMPILVGENGPEIFTPSTAGAITPNGGARGGVQIVYNIDARGSSITEAQFQRSLQLVENRAVQRAMQAGREVQLRTP
jgi:hypothetical protein